MSDFLVSQIRTYVPIAVGFVIAFLVSNGVLDESTGQEATIAISTGLTAIASALYYFGVRLAAERWPWVGAFLGVNKAPTYGE